MMRLPFVPTLIVGLAAAAMVALGIWQLERAQWKERLLADYARAAALPPVDLDPLIERGMVGAMPLAFRRALVTCNSGSAAPDIRAGHDQAGDTGYSYFLPCRPGAAGFAGRLQVNAGWSQRPDMRPAATAGLVAGTLGAIADSGPIALTSATAATPLQPSAPPSIADIPNNHLFYAAQWFFFAAAAVVIYLLALKRRQGPRP